MQEHLHEFRKKLEDGLVDYMRLPLSQRSAEAVSSMIECIHKVDELMKCKTAAVESEDLSGWAAHMKNEDGTVGAHWTTAETELYRPSEIEPTDWNLTMNMIYSDYFGVANKYGLDIVEFYVDMAKAFLLDKDAKGPHKKLVAYYNHIAK